MRARLLSTTSARRIAVATAATALTLGSAAAPAAADPPVREGESTFTLDCGAAGTYEIVTARGNGEWTPGMDVGSTTVLIPVAFGTFTVVAYDLQTGELLDEFSFEEGTVKGQGRAKGKAPVDCTFSTVFEGFDEEFGQEVRVEFSGEVSVVIRP